MGAGANQTLNAQKPDKRLNCEDRSAKRMKPKRLIHIRGLMRLESKGTVIPTGTWFLDDERVRARPAWRWQTTKPIGEPKQPNSYGRRSPNDRKLSAVKVNDEAERPGKNHTQIVMISTVKGVNDSILAHKQMTSNPKATDAKLARTRIVSRLSSSHSARQDWTMNRNHWSG